MSPHGRKNDMTRLKKINYLLEKGVNIKYHHIQYKSQCRLVIDEIEDFKYINTVEDQKLANELLDLEYDEKAEE